MPIHLALDWLSGIGLLLIAFMLPGYLNGKMIVLVAFGLFELGAALITDPGISSSTPSMPGSHWRK
jgi:hypothetical protein